MPGLTLLPDNLVFLIINFVAMSTIGRGRMACKLWLEHYADALAKHVKQDLQALVAIVTEFLEGIPDGSAGWEFFQTACPLPAFSGGRRFWTCERENILAVGEVTLVVVQKLRETLTFYERTALPFGKSRPITWPDQEDIDKLFTLCCRCRCRALVELLLVRGESEPAGSLPHPGSAVQGAPRYSGLLLLREGAVGG